MDEFAIADKGMYTFFAEFPNIHEKLILKVSEVFLSFYGCGYGIED